MTPFVDESKHAANWFNGGGAAGEFLVAPMMQLTAEAVGGTIGTPGAGPNPGKSTGGLIQNCVIPLYQAAAVAAAVAVSTPFHT